MLRYLNDNHTNATTELDRFVLFPDRGSAVLVDMISYVRFGRIPSKHFVFVHFSTSSGLVNGTSVLNCYYVVRLFATISAIVTLWVIREWIIDAVTRRVDYKNSPTLFGMALDDGRVYWFYDARVVNDIVCEYCLLFDPNLAIRKVLRIESVKNTDYRLTW